MNFMVDLNTFLITVVGGLVTYGIKGIFGMRDALTKMNGTIGKMQTELADHIKADEKQERRVEKNLDDLWSKKADRE